LHQSIKIDLRRYEQELIMAVGWTRDGGVQDQIDASIKDAVKLARSRLPEGESLTHCEECEAAIPDARRKAIPGVRLCVRCQSELEAQQTTPTGFNRRGSKDCQLR
jgi:phage/conjugal plasmid C-4 type zinc finger TraR family protein